MAFFAVCQARAGCFKMSYIMIVCIAIANGKQCLDKACRHERRSFTKANLKEIFVTSMAFVRILIVIRQIDQSFRLTSLGWQGRWKFMSW